MTRAAAKLHMAQPALSQAIAQFEDELGIQLLERHARGVTLTAAGATFLAKARLALAATEDAAMMAQSLARAEQGTIAFGFLGSPPTFDSPQTLEAFSRAHPAIDIRYHELPFPSAPTSRWMSEVDVAVCHRPAADPQVWAHTLRLEPRAVLAPARHRLAGHSELNVEQALEETFIGLHPSVEPAWAGFWSLDDHRGGPPRNVTGDRAGNPQEVLASLAARPAITTVPASIAALLASAVNGLVAIPLLDAEPTAITLVGHKDRRRNPLVEALLAFAEAANASIAESQRTGPDPTDPDGSDSLNA